MIAVLIAAAGLLPGFLSPVQNVRVLAVVAAPSSDLHLVDEF